MNLKLFVCFLVLALTFSCKTVVPWDQSALKPKTMLVTDAQRTAEYQRLSIREVTSGEGGYGAFKTTEKLAEEYYYSLGSFEHVLTQVSPNSKEELVSIKEINALSSVFAGIVLVAFLLPRDSEGLETIASLGQFVGLGGLITTMYFYNEAHHRLKDRYNSDLHEYIFSEPQSEVNTSRSLGLGMTWEIE